MNDQRTSLIKEMLADGKSYAAIGKQLGLTRERVRQIANVLGVTAATSWGSARERRAKRLAAPERPDRRPSKSGLLLARLRELLHYEPQTGIWHWRRSGRIAGTRHVSGYVQIRVDGLLHMAHVLAWFYCFEQWPKNEIDHINRRRADNRLNNLRPATHMQNMGNSSKRRSNTSGKKGVWFDLSKGRWIAEIAHIKLGAFATAAEASEAYRRAARVRFGNHAYDGA